MNWTKETPTANGFYWLRRGDEEGTIVLIRDIEDGLVECGAMIVWLGTDWDSSLCEVIEKEACLWMGPLKVGMAF